MTIAVVLAGCDGSDDGPSSAAPTQAASSSPAASASSDAAGSPDRLVAPRCRSGDDLAIGRLAVDAALGKRFLRLDVLNCTGRPLTLTTPVVAGTDADGRTGVLVIATTPVASRSAQPFTLDAYRPAAAGIAWRAEPRTDRIDELHVTVTRGGPRQLVPRDLLEIRLSTRLDYYPWVSRPQDVFG